MLNFPFPKLMKFGFDQIITEIKSSLKLKREKRKKQKRKKKEKEKKKEKKKEKEKKKRFSLHQTKYGQSLLE